jgi:hypothetical protein
LPYQALKHCKINPNRLAWPEANGLAVSFKEIREMAGQVTQLIAQVTAASFLRIVTPKQAGQMTPQDRLVLPDEIGQQGRALLGSQSRQWLTLFFNLQRP